MLYGPDGNRVQGSVHDVMRPNEILPPPNSLVAGIIADVFCVDRQDSDGNILNIPGTYLTYTVQLAPTGVFIRNVPAMMTGGHSKFLTNVLAAPSIDNQNTEENPFIVGQSVIVGFLYGSNLNPIILGPAPNQVNASTSGAIILDPQTGGNPFQIDPTTGASLGDNTYPQKQGSFQGLTWKIDKNGNLVVNIQTNTTMKVEINGTPFITVDGTNNLVDIGTGIEFGVLGNTLQTYLNSLKTAYDTHIHTGGTISSFTGTPTLPSPTVPTVTTDVLKVQ